MKTHIGLETDEIYSVAALSSHIRLQLENHFARIWVQGELSNLKQPASGHLYFSLKDDQAQLRCAWFRGLQDETASLLADGVEVIISGRVSLYEVRGDCQIIVERVIATGDGKLRFKFEQLVKKLQAQGLFETEHKKALPAIPQKIGVITSKTGAAIRDILTTLKRRAAFIPVVIYPCSVQGGRAAGEIVHAIEVANQRKECDILLLARGGGSLEDLWPFNEESVAHAIFRSQIPIVSGIGHEIDFTIADYVADQRAATPTAAAELVSPDSQALLLQLNKTEAALARPLLRLLEARQERLNWLKRCLVHPGDKLRNWMQYLDDSQLRMTRAVQQQLAARQEKLNYFDQRWQRLNPQIKLVELNQQQAQLQAKLEVNLLRLLDRYKQKLGHLSGNLNALSPLQTLNRGFAIARQDGKIICDSRQVKPEQKLALTLAHGQLDCQVLASYSDSSHKEK